MGLFSGRKALASSTFLGIGANPGAVPPAVVGSPAAAAPAPAAPAPAGTIIPPASTKGGKSAKKNGKAADQADEEDDNDDEEGDDDSDEEEMRRGSSSTICRARMRERSRISAIMGHPSASKNPDFAAHVALNMNIGRQAACALLDRTPTAPAAAAPTPSSLTTRMEEFRGIAAPAAMPSATEKQAMEAVVGDAFSKHAVTAAKRS